MDLSLPVADALILADELPVSRYFDAVVAAGASPKLAANWVLGDLMAYTKVPLTPSLFPAFLIPIVSCIVKGVKEWDADRMMDSWG